MNMGLLNKNNKVQTMSWIDYATGSNINLKNLIQLIKEDMGEMEDTQSGFHINCGYGITGYVITWFTIISKDRFGNWEYKYYILQEDGTFKLEFFYPPMDFDSTCTIRVTKEYVQKYLPDHIELNP